MTHGAQAASGPPPIFPGARHPWAFRVCPGGLATRELRSPLSGLSKVAAWVSLQVRPCWFHVTADIALKVVSGREGRGEDKLLDGVVLSHTQTLVLGISVDMGAHRGSSPW